MASKAYFDTEAVHGVLTEAGIDSTHALAILRSIEESLGGHEITKEDLKSTLDALEGRLEGKIDNVEERLERNILAIEQKLEGKISATEGRLEGTISNLNDKISHLKEGITRLERKIALDLQRLFLQLAAIMAFVGLAIGTLKYLI